MTDLFQVARTLQSFLEEQGWQFCFIGGIAVQRWAEPRLTNDVDATLFTGFSNEEAMATLILGSYSSRIDDALRFALVNRVLLLETDGIGIDIGLGGFPYEERAISRASDYQFLPDVTLRTCSAEDLVVYKAFANRPRDWEDIRSIAIRQGLTLDWETILDEIPPLAEAKEDPSIVERLVEMRARG